MGIFTLKAIFFCGYSTLLSLLIYTYIWRFVNRLLG
jgi:hypothetical protein